MPIVSNIELSNIMNALGELFALIGKP